MAPPQSRGRPSAPGRRTSTQGARRRLCSVGLTCGPEVRGAWWRAQWRRGWHRPPRAGRPGGRGLRLRPGGDAVHPAAARAGRRVVLRLGHRPPGAARRLPAAGGGPPPRPGPGPAGATAAPGAQRRPVARRGGERAPHDAPRPPDAADGRGAARHGPDRRGALAVARARARGRAAAAPRRQRPPGGHPRPDVGRPGGVQRRRGLRAREPGRRVRPPGRDGPPHPSGRVGAGGAAAGAGRPRLPARPRARRHRDHRPRRPGAPPQRRPPVDERERVLRERRAAGPHRCRRGAAHDPRAGGRDPRRAAGASGAGHRCRGRALRPPHRRRPGPPLVAGERLPDPAGRRRPLRRRPHVRRDHRGDPRVAPPAGEPGPARPVPPGGRPRDLGLGPAHQPGGVVARDGRHRRARLRRAGGHRRVHALDRPRRGPRLRPAEAGGRGPHRRGLPRRVPDGPPHRRGAMGRGARSRASSAATGSRRG